MKTTANAVDWSSLPRDLLVNIAKLTLSDSVEAFMAFRSTCSSFREVAQEEECVNSFKGSRVPFLMIPEKSEFYSLGRKKSYRLRTPLRKGKFCSFIESRFGWILTVEISGKPHLMYPFSEASITLSNYKTLPGIDPRGSYCFFRRSVLSANPSRTSDYVLVVLTYEKYLAFWRPGNQNWTKIKSSSEVRFVDLIFRSTDQKFYAIEKSCQIWSWDMESDSLVQVIIVKQPRIFGRYLVESSASELLLIGTDYHLNFFNKVRDLQVYRLDFNSGVWERVTSVKDAIFVGNNTASFSILPGVEDSAIKSNCIYFSDGYTQSKGIYKLEDGNIQQLPEQLDQGSCINNFPLWISPSSLSFMNSLDLCTVTDQPYFRDLLFYAVILTSLCFNLLTS